MKEHQKCYTDFYPEYEPDPDFDSKTVADYDKIIASEAKKTKGKAWSDFTLQELLA
ncbi:MAG: hypothetical protein E6Z06_08525 [Clostridiales bacterium]|nr:hypothetical protein [Clostridiales bacterium]DAU68282.1 MAG TPA: Cytochrome c oxidase subunit VIc [Caudoviricetes sp.]